MGDAIRHAFGASALLCVTTATAVQAAPIVNWTHAFKLEASGGLTDPVVLIGFNPQPDPPVRITTLDLSDPTAPRLVIPGQSNPQLFTLFLAIGVGELQPGMASMDFDLPPLKGANLSSYLFRAIGDGSVHDVRLTFSTSTAGIIDGTSLVGFNPQPDPPGNFGAFDVMGLEFGFTSLSDATVTLSIIDEAGAPVSFAAVPEPATLSLVGLGVLGVGWARRRQRLREVPAGRPERKAMPHAIGHELGISVLRLIAVLVACAAMPARADTISMNSAFALPGAAGENGVASSAVFSVPQFNPALGTLEGISYQVARGPLNFAWSVDQEGTCCGILTKPEPVLRTSLHYLGGTLEMKFDDLPWSGPFPVVGPDSDAAPDFTGSDAHTFLGTFPVTTLSAPITDPFLFSVFTGSGAVPLEFRTQLQLTSGQPGPGIFAHDSLISPSSAQWFFAYEYTPAVIVEPGPGPGPSPVPEPTSLSLVGFSAVALALRRRRRVRNAGGAAVPES